MKFTIGEFLPIIIVQIRKIYKNSLKYMEKKVVVRFYKIYTKFQLRVKYGKE